ncbi:hypothetical protein N7509_001171 [Penicillium cosmopolitanum]|uniref:Uncharacterized protein n=1 Tax=Penicillium cosmopolitanum TaxID=1131564 RepID=A0A9X0BEX8_9EURO|nr:uncharacterized protein N7509_001171 [Penicillium cosmopolitanum]KAJ5414544.1 hypothetical protein N7509_001171 [Penicillium cosmopolitanum]
MNLASIQGQIQEPFMVASNRMASNTDSISEFAELDPLFEGLEAFTADHLLDFLSRDGPADDTPLNPGNAPPTLSLPTVVEENNPDNFYKFNGGSKYPSNRSLR